MYDVIIIGGSAAGVSAAIYAARRKLNFVMVTGDIGGEVLLSGEIENYPGIKHTDGVQMTQWYLEQLDYYTVERHTETLITHITKNGNTIILDAQHNGEKKEYRAKAIIIATGVKPRHLEIPGEKEFYQKGVTYCTVCDGPLFKNKTTVTIGSGNSALESSLMMAGIAKKHYVLLKYDDFKGDQVLIDKVRAAGNVTVLPRALTKEIKGATTVAQAVYTDIEGKEQMLDVQGVFVHIGMVPQSGFLGDTIKKDPTGKIVIDKLCATNVPGIFAAGDVTDTPYQQIVIASGHGATAALAAIDYVNRWKE